MTNKVQLNAATQLADLGEGCCMATGTFQFLKRLVTKNAKGERVVNDDLRQQ